MLKIIALLLVATSTRALSRGAGKEGVCPYAQPWMFCPPAETVPADTCTSDDNCPGLAKCCAIGSSNCGHRKCVADLLVQVSRPGSCPEDWTAGVICDVFECDEDAHCPENHKCCSNPCGSTECVLVH